MLSIVAVQDTGAGISRENQRLLFREGMQFNPEKLQAGGGSGFGLFISKSIVGLHDGKIRAFSAGEGQGSSFMFRIPMRRKKVLVNDGAAAAIQHKQQHHNHHGLEQGPRLGLGPGPGLQMEQIDLHDRPHFSAVELVAPQRWLNEPLASSSLSSTSLPMVVSTRRSAILAKGGGGGGVTDGETRLAPGLGLGLEPVPVSGSGLPKGQGLASLVPGLPGGYGTMLPLPLSISQKAGYYRRVSFPPPEDLDLQHSPRSHPPPPPAGPHVLHGGAQRGRARGLAAHAGAPRPARAQHAQRAVLALLPGGVGVGCGMGWGMEGWKGGDELRCIF